MAQIAQQTNERWIERHPNAQNMLTSLASLFHYIFNGQIIVDFGRWVVLYCGRVSETAMLMATLWVTATFVTPELTSKLGGTAVTLSSFSMVAFSLLPEVILFSAIIKTLKHCKVAWQQKNNIVSWSWAVLYAIPTLTFFGMTIFTISSFVVTNGHLQQATGQGIVFRCLAGWFYSLVGLIHAGMSTQNTEQKEVEITPSILDKLYEQLEVQRQEIARMSEQHTNEIMRLEAQSSERLSTTIETVMQRVTQTVIEHVSIAQISTASVPMIEQHRTNQEDVSEHLAYLEDDQTFACMEEGTNEQDNKSVFSQYGIVPLTSEPVSEQNTEQEQSTEPLSVPNVSPVASVRSQTCKERTSGKPVNNELAKKVQTILKRNPNAGPTFIAQKLGISKGYASELKTKITANA